MSHVFISYKRSDQGYARRLANDLRGHGFDVWIDDRIDFGERWWQTIVQAIKDCGAFVVVMSPEAEKSEWVEKEIMLAKREPKPILPLLLKGKVFAILIDTQFADVTGERMPSEEFYRRLRAVLTPKDHTGAFVAPQPSVSPRRGLWALGAVLVLIGIVAGILALNGWLQRGNGGGG
jgi:hypothetical protein